MLLHFLPFKMLYSSRLEPLLESFVGLDGTCHSVPSLPLDDAIIFMKVINGGNKEIASKGVILQRQTENTHFRNLVKQLVPQSLLVELFQTAVFQLFG